jgi:predicted GNAT family N-acyltransferase
MKSEIGVVVSEPSDLLWVPRLRKWIEDNKPLLGKLGVEVVVEPMPSCDEAIAWRACDPRQHILVMFGGESGNGAAKGCTLRCAEPIIVGVDPTGAPAGACASASALGGQNAVRCPNVEAQLRKSLIRSVLLRTGIEVRQPRTDNELAGYLSLRYSVWKSIGYLRDDNKATRVPWEIDFWDRTAIPLCAITPDNSVIGCTRLIQNLGDEQEFYVASFQKLLDAAKDPQLTKLFQYPNVPTHPFDVLFQFPGFGKEFKELIKRNVKMAEVGRVVVHPDSRGHYLSEVLVDSAVSLAKQRGMALLFLACHDELGVLYSKCGFAAIAGLQSKNFFNIQVPSIVMERRI